MEEKIIEYELVRNGDQKLFQERINYLLNKNEGWKPLAGIALAGTGSAVIMAQSMVKISQGA